MRDDLLVLFRETGALLDGRFVLRSSLHSRQYSQCTRLLQHTDIAAHVCGILADRLHGIECDIFAGKGAAGLVLRCGFQIKPGEEFTVVEDVVTRSGPVQQTINIARDRGGIVKAVGVIVDHSKKTKPDFGALSLAYFEFGLKLSNQMRYRPT